MLRNLKPFGQYWHLKSLSVILVGFMMASCTLTLDDPSTDGYFLKMDVAFLNPVKNEPSIPTELDNKVSGLIQAAKSYIYIATEHLRDYTLANLLLAKVRADSKFIVRVVGDIDNQTEPGFVLLSSQFDLLNNEGADALLPKTEKRMSLVLGNSKGRMSSNFMVVDDHYVWFSTGSPDGYTFNRNFDIGFVVESSTSATTENMVEDFRLEFVQLHAGIFGDSRTRYSDLAKSPSNPYTEYHINGVTAHLYFGPQERLIKQMIDEVYNARSSIRIISRHLSNEYLYNALIQKAGFGFPIDVILENSLWEEYPSRGKQLSDISVNYPGMHIYADLKDFIIHNTIVQIDRHNDADPQTMDEKIMICTNELIQDDSVHDGVMIVLDRDFRTWETVPDIIKSIHSYINLIFANHQ